MREDVRRDMIKGREDLEKSLAILAEHCLDFGDDQIKLIDDETDGEIGNDLDTLSGIDGYQKGPLGMIAIAGRAQRGTNWRTFTIRISRPSGARTEYEKRLWAVKHRHNGVLFPYWTTHSYLTSDGSSVLAIGLAKTEELYPWIEKCEQNGHRFGRKPAPGGQWFLYVPWDMYQQSGLYFFEYSLKPPLTITSSPTIKHYLETDFIPDDDTDPYAFERGMQEADRSSLIMANDDKDQLL
jgi:hypothetical protein